MNETIYYWFTTWTDGSVMFICAPTQQAAIEYAHNTYPNDVIYVIARDGVVPERYINR